jgi:hypothetical protein
MNNGWKDCGLIVDLDVINRQNSTNFRWAQGPQIIDMGTHYRLYFSSRIPDEDMKPVSKVYFLDFCRDFQEKVGGIREVKIQDGLLGGFDQHGIFPFHPYVIDAKIIMALTSGWKRMSNVDIDMSIGQAISLDGEHFARNGYGPLISAAPSEPFLIGDPFVLKMKDTYSLYYIFGTRWSDCGSNPERTYKIGRMNSDDGFTFARILEGRQIVPDTIDNEAQAMPTVVKIDSTYHMFYCYRSSFDFRDGGNNGYRLGHAISLDGEVWELRHSDLPSSFPHWSINMQCYPHATIIDSKLYLFFNGNKFGKNGIGLITKEIGAFDVTRF